MRLVSVAMPRSDARAAHVRAARDDVAVPPVGARVLVPLGTRMMTGCVLGTANGAAARTPPGPRRSKKSSTFWTIDHSCRTTSWRLRCGSRTTTRAAWEKRSPPRCLLARWIESERHAHITEAGRVRISGERGLRRTVLEKLQAGAPGTRVVD